jgi:hypothetical protein
MSKAPAQTPAEQRRSARRLLERDARRVLLEAAGPSADELRHEAIRRHYAEETVRFSLPPWHERPCHADGDPPAADDKSMGAKTWHRARELRDGLLRENPAHYDDTL